MPGISGEPGVSMTSPLSDSFDCQTTSRSARWLQPSEGMGSDWRGHMSGDGGRGTGDGGERMVQVQVTAHSWHRGKNPPGMLGIV